METRQSDTRRIFKETEEQTNQYRSREKKTNSNNTDKVKPDKTNTHKPIITKHHRQIVVPLKGMLQLRADR